MSAHQVVCVTLMQASRRVSSKDAIAPLQSTEAGLRMALIDAGLDRDHDRIDAITAALAKLGRCRHSSDISMLEAERIRLGTLEAKPMPEPEAEADGPQPVGLRPQEQAVLQLLAGGAMSSRDVSSTLGIANKYAGSILSRLKSHGLIRRTCEKKRSVHNRIIGTYELANVADQEEAARADRQAEINARAAAC